jgi:hypothetical protein
MNKTCYFCEKENCKNCKPFCSTFGYAYVICDNCNGFTPNADWLYIEQLEKENEELKRKIQSYKYEREKLHGYLANIPNNPSVDSLNQMSISNRYVYDPIIGGYVTKESKDEVKE